MEFYLEKNGVSAKCKTFGGELVSFVKDGCEYVWKGDAKYWSGQAPVLFPVVCSPKDDIIITGSKEYPMPKHGIARKREYLPIEITPTSAEFEIRDNADSIQNFPYPFILRIKHEISEDGFSTTYSVTNTGDTKMPFCIGGHPGFSCPMHEGEKFEDYSILFDDMTGSTTVITRDDNGYMDPSLGTLDVIKNNELKLDYGDFVHDCLIIEGLKKKEVKLVNRNTGHGIIFNFDRFDALAIWTPIEGGAPFLCFEPWNGLPASVAETPELTNKKYVVTLDIGKTYTTGYSVKLI